MNSRSLLFSTLAAIVGFSFPARADEKPNCYQFKMTESAESSVVVETKSELWCYQRLTHPVGAVYIYNADDERVRPELAMVVEADGLLTHGSLLGGKTTVHRMKASQYNPFPVPLREPTDVPTAIEPTRDLSDSAQEVLKYLLSEPAQFEDLTLREGVVTGQAVASFKPWRGYWWPYKGRPLAGSSTSPLVKYDRFVRAREGASPGSQSYENAHHSYHGVWWEGHCNGWAASTVLRSEPKTSKLDSRTGIRFSVSDQKGLLAEADYCANASFFGRRNNGSGDPRDIYPALFHQTLTYYIGRLGKPIVCDYRSDSPVDNHVISGYTMSIVKTGPNTSTVTAQVTKP